MAKITGKLHDVPVEIVCLSVTPPVLRKGRATLHEDGGPCEVVLEGPEPRLEPGMRVVVDGGPDRAFRIKGLIAATEGNRFRLETQRVVPADKRSFPRMHGGIHVRYRVLKASEAEAVSSRWVSGERAPAKEGEWRKPDPFMDFSGTGLRFEDELHCRTDDLLLIELALPSSRERWHATARVVRVDPIRSEDLGWSAEEERKGAWASTPPTHQIAVQFVTLPVEATEALTAFAMRIQEALLKP